MRAHELDHRELLELDPDGGVIRFAGQRALLFDAVAIGLFRKYVVENFGLTAARAVFTQFGFAHGWRMAEAMRAEFNWDSDEDWRLAGTRIHALEGLFRVDDGNQEPLSHHGLVLLASYEAEQHLLHFGRSEDPACWTICGFTSGYLSRCRGEVIYVLEDRCLGRGDAACHLLGRTREEWGDQRADALKCFEPSRLVEGLDVSLSRVAETLKIAERRLHAHSQKLVRVTPDISEPFGLVAKSPIMRKAVDLARRVAKVDATVLITGESGTGKERIARLIHQESTRASGPFIAVNCGAITETLLESELFGHVRGAFTGATQDRPGLFAAAHTGTLLLDEVGEVSMGMQIKLLRALQEREIRRVGDNASQRIDVRVLAATNRDLTDAVTAGTFRQDLYYRLKVVELRMPPLRQRTEDVLPLARLLLANAARQMKRKVSGVSPATADQLLRYSWPGNVRELENAMERAVALASGRRVEVDDLPEEVRHSARPAQGHPHEVRRLEEVEKDYILTALELNGKNQVHTAKQLGIGAATLYRKLKSYGLIGGGSRNGGSPGAETASPVPK